MALTLIQKVNVASYGPRPEVIGDHEGAAKGWLTKSTTSDIPRALRVLPEFVEEVKEAFPGDLAVLPGSQHVGCVNGIPLLKTQVALYTLSPFLRPRTLYRAVHDGQPHGGIKSRLGRGSDAIFFQIQLQKHLRWQCREPSPFLSATNRWDKAWRVARVYQDRGFTGIRIVTFETDHPSWRHSVQRMWTPRRLLTMLNLQGHDKAYFRHEYLIEHSIPEASIIRSWSIPTPKKSSTKEEVASVAQESGRDLEDVKKDSLNEQEADANADTERSSTKRKAQDQENGEAEDDKEAQPTSEVKNKRTVRKRYKIGPKMGPSSADT